MKGVLLFILIASLNIGFAQKVDSLYVVLQEEAATIKKIEESVSTYRFNIPEINANGSSSSQLTISQNNKGYLQFITDFPNDKINRSGISSDIWGNKSVHRFSGTVNFPEKNLMVINEGNQNNRLTFLIVKSIGYVYVRGIGKVIYKEDTVSLNSKTGLQPYVWSYFYKDTLSIFNAAEQGNLELFTLLHDKGANASVNNKQGEFLPEYLQKKRKYDFIAILIKDKKYKDYYSEKLKEDYKNAIDSDDKKLLSFILNLFEEPDMNYEAAVYAVQKGKLSTYKYLYGNHRAPSKLNNKKPIIFYAVDNPSTSIFRYMLLRNTERKAIKYNGKSLRRYSRMKNYTHKLMRMDNALHWQINGAFQSNYYKSDSVNIIGSVGLGFQLFTRLIPKIDFVTGYYFTGYNFKGNDAYKIFGSSNDYVNINSHELSFGLQLNAYNHLNSGSLYLQTGYTQRYFQQKNTNGDSNYTSKNLNSPEDAIYFAVGFGGKGKSRFVMEFRYTKGITHTFIGHEGRLNSLTLLNFGWGI